jgi:DNA-directed RNA polymerase specialized sigma24 family protein
LNDVRRRARETRRARDVSTPVVVSGSDEPLVDNPLARLIETEMETGHARLVATVLASCTERQRTAYDLRYRRGLTIPAIAEVLGITGKSAEQLVSRVTHVVLQRLRSEIERLG